MIEIIPALTDEAIEEVSELARVIWHEWFPGIITTEQIDYMLEKFLTPEVLRDEIEHGYELFELILGEETIGFILVQPDYDQSRLFLSKIYLKKEYRGKGYSSIVFNFLEVLSRARSIEKIWLTVNKHNQQAIDVYTHRDFKVIDEVESDIGNGYVMDDYIMELDLYEA